MNRHQFQNSARQFRAGKISLDVFTDRVFATEVDSNGHSVQSSEANPSSKKTQQVPTLPTRVADSHKGDYGRVLVVAGSDGMAGAAALAGMAALRAGAGLVTVATAKVCQNVVAGFHPAIMTVGLPCDDCGRINISSAETLWTMVPSCDCLAIGPGIGQNGSLERLVKEIYQTAPMPTVIDADGLNNLGTPIGLARPSGPRVLTPHPGEFRRLIDSTPTDRASLEQAAVELARAIGATLVLKGHQTLVTDGQQLHHNQTGNPGMATAGSGDVLTGILAGLIGQGLSTWDASVLGCHIHGTAGDIVAANQNQNSVVATDLIDALPRAMPVA